MIENQGTAMQTARAYCEAWANKDLEQAMSFIADDIVCDARPDGSKALAPTRDSWSRSSSFIFDRVPYEAAADIPRPFVFR